MVTTIDHAIMMIILLWLLIVVIVPDTTATVVAQDASATNNQTCTWESDNKDDCPTNTVAASLSSHRSNNLQSISFDVGRGNETAFVYVSPDISTFYQEQQSSGSTRRSVIRKPAFQGLCAKFINLSPDPVRVYWDPGNGKEKSYISDLGPFEAAATAAYPSHVFVLTPRNDPNTILKRFVVKREDEHGSSMLYPYDPIKDDPTTGVGLNDEQVQLYTLQKENLEFDVVYRQATGRNWLSLFRNRQRPQYHMWDANYFGQEHIVPTRETFFEKLPPESALGGLSIGEHRRLDEYRSSSVPHGAASDDYQRGGQGHVNLTLKVLSCEPRVFEIQNFLSPTEVEYILQVGNAMTLKRSTTRAGSTGHDTTSEATRTSRNTWVSRQRSPIVDAIYRRAADLLQIDEALLRRRNANEYPDLRTRGSIAEDLQLVHYQEGQQYTPHHDWSVPSVRSTSQPSRFATVLFYLNDDMVGGETSFPRWKNAETSQQLEVKPETGKAILFYSILPDGNMDERSEHAALRVRKGEKWLTNLWVWDPSR